MVIPIADRHIEVARQVQSQLKGAGLRVEVDDSGEQLGAQSIAEVIALIKDAVARRLA